MKALAMTADTEHTAMGAEQPGYDVAISFLAKDQLIAGELADRLVESLKVFYFPRAQEKLAGTDGMESMRTPFVSGSRVTVILYREQWGKTEWTSLEESAIKDGCLNRGWSTLMFVQLDETSKLPPWLPRTQVRFALERYGIDQLVGAIKLRVQEQGGTIEKPDAASRARRVHREADFLAERERLFKDRTWIERTLHASIRIILQSAVDLVKEHGKNLQPQIRTGAKTVDAKDFHCVMTDERVSVAAGWKQGIFSYVGEEACLFVREFRGSVMVSPGLIISKPELLKEQKFVVELNANRELVWLEVGKQAPLTCEELANRIAMIFFDLIGQANRGEVRMSDI
jgi:hypothetical protein